MHYQKLINSLSCPQFTKSPPCTTHCVKHEGCCSQHEQIRWECEEEGRHKEQQEQTLAGLERVLLELQMAGHFGESMEEGLERGVNRDSGRV